MAKATAPTWDLSDLYSSISDPKIFKDKKQIEKTVKDFNTKYKDNKKIDILAALSDFSEIVNKLSIVSGFTYLKFSENTQDTKVSSLLQDIQEFDSQVSASTAWFLILVAKLGDTQFKKLQKQPHFGDFAHFIQTRRQLADFMLSEKEENILVKKSVTADQAFVKLYDQIDSTQEYELTIKGKKQKLSYSQIGQIMKNDPDRKVRENAVKAVSDGLTNKQTSLIYTYILNTLLLDKKIEDGIRGYKFAQQATYLNYETPAKVVEAMIKAVSSSWSISERYYQAKSKLLGQKLFEWDRYSDVYVLKNKTQVSWEQTKQIILSSFSEFSTEFAGIAKLFFDNNWIDAQTRPGKKGGAYCSYISPKKHPYVFMNFNSSLEDTIALGHELGHAIHGYLNKKHNILQFDSSTAVAEIASIFAESIVFDNLLVNTKNKQEKINMLANKLQGKFATVFRQTAFYLFESELHELRRKKGELTTNQISDLYQKHLQPMFGKGLTLTDSHKPLWMPIAHFYHYNFYVYSYSFGELLAISLYALYKHDGQKFIDKYIQALSAGGSKSPIEITKIMGVDITKESFWKNGLELIEKEVEEFEQLVLE